MKKTQRYFFIFWLMVISIYIYVAYLLWMDHSITRKISAGNININTDFDLNTMPGLVSKPLAKALLINSTNVKSDNQVMISISNEYTKRRPLDPQGWYWLSLYNDRVGNRQKAIDNLNVSLILSKNNSRMLMRIFNLHLKLGLIDQAMLVANDLVFADPQEFRKIFYLLTRLNSNYSEVVKTVIPSIVPVHRAHPKEMYFKWALNDAVRANNELLAKAVWENIPSDLKLGSSFGMRYLRYLSGRQIEYDGIARVWQNLTGQTVLKGQIGNSGFEELDMPVSPCWEVIETQGVKWGQSSKSFKGQKSLMVSFDGEKNIHYSHLKCLILVDAGEVYTLQGMWAGESVSTLSGPFVDIHTPGPDNLYARSKALVGDWSWTKFEIEFHVPLDVSVVQIRIRRNKTNSLDNKLSGRVWFDDFQLIKKNTESSINKKVE
mgnify:CR=1 FL=1